jgi:hypothetical protein
MILVWNKKKGNVACYISQTNKKKEEEHFAVKPV